MTRNQWLVLASALLLLCILYFGFSKVPPKQQDLEKSRFMNVEATSLTNLVNTAYEQISPAQKTIDFVFSKNFFQFFANQRGYRFRFTGDILIEKLPTDLFGEGTIALQMIIYGRV